MRRKDAALVSGVRRRFGFRRRFGLLYDGMRACVVQPANGRPARSFALPIQYPGRGGALSCRIPAADRAFRGRDGRFGYPNTLTGRVRDGGVRQSCAFRDPCGMQIQSSRSAPGGACDTTTLSVARRAALQLRGDRPNAGPLSDEAYRP